MTVRDYLEYMQDQQDMRQKGIGPSGATSCIRRHAYGFLDVEKTDTVSKKKADLGTLVHLGWDTLILSRYAPARRATKVKVEFPGTNLRSGEADDVDFVSGRVMDLKTTSSRNFQRWLDYDGPGDDYWSQVMAYAWGLTAMGHQIREVGILGLDVETADIEEWIRPYDPEFGERVVATMQERQALLDSAAEKARAGADPLDVVDTFPREGRGRGSFPCDWCPWATQCLGDGVVPLTRSDVDDAEVAAAAARYVAARRKRDEASAAMEAERKVMEGRSGTFDGFSVTWGKPSEKYVPDAAAMQALLEDMGETVPLVLQRRAGALRVGKARRA